MTPRDDSHPLSGIRVVDFGQYLAGPMTAMFLADSGADVIHVDPPGGPRWDHPVNATLHRGKRCIELDLTDQADRTQAARLIADADVVVEGFRPGVMARLGLDPARMLEESPHLIWCSLPGFASDDPRAGVAAWEGVLCSATGLYRAGFYSDEPQFNALTLPSNFAAFSAAHRIATALLARQETGRGAALEVSLFDACFQAIGFHGEIPASRQVVDPLSYWLHVDMQPVRAQDGRFLYFDSPTRGLQAFLDHYLPGYNLLDVDEAILTEISERLAELIAQKSAAEWERIAQEEFHGAIGVAQDIADWLDDDHARSAQDVLEIEDPRYGRVVQAGYAVQLSKTPPSARAREQVGASQAASATTWMSPRWDLPAPHPSADDPGLPLAGLKVVDCSTLLAGPNTTRILAQYGADVIKIERTGICTGDTNPLSDDPMALVGHRTVNAGKRTIFLDLAHTAGREAMAGILHDVDVLCHNFTPAAANKLGLGVDRVRELSKDVVYTSVSLHSRGGYRSSYRGHDPLAQMVTGMSSMIGGASGPRMASIALNDHAAGHLGAFGVILALLDRRRTGRTQEVNSSLTRTATLHLVPFMLSLSSEQDRERVDDGLTTNRFNRFYRAQDGYFFLAHHRSDVRDLLSRVPLLEGVGAIGDSELEAWMSARFSSAVATECVAQLQAAGIGAHRNLLMMEAVTDDDAFKRGLTAVIDHPGIGRAVGVAHRMLGSKAHAGEFLAARRPGLDTLDILQESGSADRIVELLRDRVVATGENPVVTLTSIPGSWAPHALTDVKDVTAATGSRPSARVIARVSEDASLPVHWPERSTGSSR